MAHDPAAVFAAAELGQTVSREAYQEEAPHLRCELLELQGALRRAPFNVLVLVNGVEGAGKSETVNTLLEWLDARWIRVHALGDPTDEERERPAFWRFWRQMPPRGMMGIFFGSWYTAPVLDRVQGRSGDAEMTRQLERIVRFEEMLAADGTLILKFWLHISKREQRKRLRKLHKDPDRQWMVTPLERELARHYDDFVPITAHMIERTCTEFAPWRVVEATDPRHRYLTVGREIRDALAARLQAGETPAPPPAPRPVHVPSGRLAHLNLGKRLSRERYEAMLPRLQGRLHRLQLELRKRGRSLTVVFEGPDAGGKGGAIRRITQALDSRNYQVIQVAAPTQEEKAHQYLWRFWRHVPRVGHVTIYDRSWYGRVLVERVEGFCREDEWRRAYDEINDFEDQMVEFGTVVVKFWLQISSEEQFRRFTERQATPHKRHKITAEDWRNRDRWDAYEQAAEEMIHRTDTLQAPWDLVAGEDKPWARVRILTVLCERIEERIQSGS